MSKIRIFRAKLKQVAQLLSIADDQVENPNSKRRNPQASGFPILTPSTQAPLEQPGTWIGQYKLLSILGEGGMGIVFLAEQNHPFHRDVALKIIKPSMDSKRVVARFETEQQTLALLEHLHIAHIHDAGLTQNGRSYFVMEYVEGIPITEYCDHYKLTVEERLFLFLDVCQAIQYAHQKGIIHRDIKPSNILVTDKDGKAIPKVIDFGVARALNLPLSERTFYTEQGQWVGTPEYMSPEQINPEYQDLDTRTDVYSLGLMMYELLVGVLPFDVKTFHEGRVETIRKIICEEYPATPSTRLSKTSAKESTQLAHKRRSGVRTLRNKLRGDLDWITLKAIEKDRTRRYASIDAMTTDIRNYLNDQPISAAPPSAIYQAGKFMRRHRQTLVILGMAVLILIAVTVTAIMSIRVERDRTYAEFLEHRNALVEAQTLAGNNRYEQAKAKIAPLLKSPHLGRQAKLLQAQIMIELNEVAKATIELKSLLDKDDEIAGHAHFLLSNIYYEDDPWSAGEREEIQTKYQYHRREAERLIAGTADYVLLQARASYDVRQRLKLLSDALEIDNNHYDSLRERAYIHYAQEDYPEMSEDASQMIVLCSGDPTGYLLRAVARREQGRLDEAIADHSEAIALSPDDSTLYEHRSNTYVRMDRYALALADAQRAAELDPNNLHYSGITFALKVACGQYEEALQQYEQLLSQAGTDLEYSPFMPSMVGHWNTKDFFGFIAAGYTFWIPARQASWPLPPEQPRSAPIWAMREATEFYNQLSRHARCVKVEGFSPSGHPDGTKIAFSAGTHWASAVAVMNVQTGATEILTAPGKDPQWSPDGRTIAFVRDRKSIAMNAVALMGHIPTTERRRTQGPLPSVEEVWSIDVASSKLRRIAEGNCPSWGADPQQVYFHSGGAFCSASIDGNDPTPTTVLEPTGPFPVISPDGRYVAEADFRWLRIWDIHSGEQVLQWAAPPFPATGILFNWSPDSRQLSIGGFATCRMGLWILDIQTGEAHRTLNGHFMTAVWSPDRCKMAIVTGPPHIEIWLAELDPNQPTAQAFGDGRTIEEHCRDLIEFYSRGVADDLNYPDSHLRRTDAALWIEDSRSPQFLEELERAFRCTPYHAGGCAARAQAILSGPPEMRNKLLPLALLLARKAVEKEPENTDFRKTLDEVLSHIED